MVYAIIIDLLMIFNSKNTFLIVHKNLQFALQIPEQTFEKKSTVELGPVNQNNNKQLWLLQGKAVDKIQIVNGFSDYCLTQEGEKLSIKKGTGRKDQAWAIQIVKDSNGKEIKIRLGKSKNKYLSVQTGEIILKEVSPVSADIWVLFEVKTNQMLNNSCFIISQDTKKLIDVPQSTKKEEEQITIWEPNYRYNQRWNIFRAGEVYVIKSFYNKMNLDIAKEIIQDKSPIIQYPSHGGANQFWRFERVDPIKNIFRIYTCYDKQLELGHEEGKLQLCRGRRFLWEIQGYFPN